MGAPLEDSMNGHDEEIIEILKYCAQCGGITLAILGESCSNCEPYPGWDERDHAQMSREEEENE